MVPARHGALPSPAKPTKKPSNSPCLPSIGDASAAKRRIYHDLVNLAPPARMAKSVCPAFPPDSQHISDRQLTYLRDPNAGIRLLQMMPDSLGKSCNLAGCKVVGAAGCMVVLNKGGQFRKAIYILISRRSNHHRSRTVSFAERPSSPAAMKRSGIAVRCSALLGVLELPAINGYL